MDFMDSNFNEVVIIFRRLSQYLSLQQHYIVESSKMKYLCKLQQQFLSESIKY